MRCARTSGSELRYVSRHLPLPEHPNADLAAAAAEAAGQQGKFHDMQVLLLAHQEQLQVEDLIGYAGDLGLDMEDFVRDLDNEDLARTIREDVASAEASGAQQTPTFFVGGMRHTGPHDTASLIEALEDSRRR